MTTRKEQMAPPGKLRVIAFSNDPFLEKDGRYVGDYSPGFAFRMADEQNKNTHSTHEDYQVFDEWGKRARRNGEKTSAKKYHAATQTPPPDLEEDDEYYE